MFIKLTNASPPFQDKMVVIKKDIIVSIFETEIEFPVTPVEEKVVEMPLKEIVTVVFCGTVGTWYVRETVKQVYELL